MEEHPEAAEARKTALIEILEMENSLVADKELQRLAAGGELKKEERLSEKYTDYYADLIAAVTSFKDPRSLHALLGAIDLTTRFALVL